MVTSARCSVFIVALLGLLTVAAAARESSPPIPLPTAGQPAAPSPAAEGPASLETHNDLPYEESRGQGLSNVPFEGPARNGAIGIGGGSGGAFRSRGAAWRPTEQVAPDPGAPIS